MRATYRIINSSNHRCDDAGRPHFVRNLAKKITLDRRQSCPTSATRPKITQKYIFHNLPQIRIKILYGRIISKKAQIRIGYRQFVPCGMSGVTLHAIIKDCKVVERVNLCERQSLKEA